VRTTFLEVSDLRQDGSFLPVFQFSQTIYLITLIKLKDRNGARGVMVSVLTSSALDRRFETQSG
jgi:hypothetical protein